MGHLHLPLAVERGKAGGIPEVRFAPEAGAGREKERESEKSLGSHDQNLPANATP